MRLLLVFGIWCLTLGSVQSYFWFARSVRPPALETVQELAAEGDFAIEISLTFEAAADEFTDAPALDVSVNGKTIVHSNDRISPETPLRLDKVEHVVVGRNEFFLRCSSAPESQLAARAAKITILRGGHPLAEHTIWAQPGEELGGTFIISVATEAGEKHNHADD